MTDIHVIHSMSRESRAYARMLASIIQRISGRGGLHVDVRMADGTQYAGEIRTLTWTGAGPMLDMTGPDAPDHDVRVSDIVSMRQTSSARCRYCLCGW